jgi:hypothetical protein
MELEPAYTPVGNLFDNKPMFFIPKYQRAYAWELESVRDFLKDLKNCFLKRKTNSPINHFFGGILSVEHHVQGVARQHEYEIIDGQQRVSTFTLLMACLVKKYQELLGEAQGLGDSTNEHILEGRIKDLSNRFIEFNQEVQRVVKTFEVLRLSKPDHPFYQDLIRNRNPLPERDSHHKLLEAYKSISKAIQDMIDKSNLVTKMDDLEIIQNVIDSDFTVLHMVTKAREDAFRLFQVINDRGTSLTEGDLLRAKTLEILEGFDSEQNSVEELWNSILSDPPNKTADYLHWIYESNQGKRAPQNALFDNFIDAFFPQYKQPKLTLQDAQQVYIRVRDVYEDILKCRKLIDGQWLYAVQQPITGWDRNRLNLLMKELDHKLSIPLLLAASKLDHRRFSEIVQVIEKAFFRYKIICNEHATPLQSVYREEAVLIRQNLAAYNIASLKSKLQNLMNARASDPVFKGNLELLGYKETGGGSNKPLKHFLTTVEYYYQWYKQGAVGEPNCSDKSRIYDFASTSIEHIYPQGAASNSAVYDAGLEPLKHSLGNLTILDPAQNGTGADDDFQTKKPIYKISSICLTREEVAEKTAWTLAEVDNFKNLLVDIGMKVFRV